MISAQGLIRLRADLLYWFFWTYGKLCIGLVHLGAPVWLSELPRTLTPGALRRAGARVYMDREEAKKGGAK